MRSFIISETRKVLSGVGHWIRFIFNPGSVLSYFLVDFFISYASPDRGWAEWIGHVLEDAGLKVIVQEWDFRPGSNFIPSITSPKDRPGKGRTCSLRYQESNPASIRRAPRISQARLVRRASLFSTPLRRNHRGAFICCRNGRFYKDG